jgi:hypothetical protein
MNAPGLICLAPLLAIVVVYVGLFVWMSRTVP